VFYANINEIYGKDFYFMLTFNLISAIFYANMVNNRIGSI